jgi:hypothetical protein
MTRKIKKNMVIYVFGEVFEDCGVFMMTFCATMEPYNCWTREVLVTLFKYEWEMFGRGYKEDIAAEVGEQLYVRVQLISRPNPFLIPSDPFRVVEQRISGATWPVAAHPSWETLATLSRHQTWRGCR